MHGNHQAIRVVVIIIISINSEMTFKKPSHKKNQTFIVKETLPWWKEHQKK